jgi:hypothetical protein
MEPLSVQEFNGRSLPSFLKNREKLDAFFITPNKVFGRKSGPVETGSDDLNITVVNDIYPAESLERRIDFKTIPDTADLLFVIYLKSQAVQFSLLKVATKLKKDFAKSTIVVITCNCNSGDNRRLVEPLQKSGVVSYFIEDYRCGGLAAMPEILTELILAWNGVI